MSRDKRIMIERDVEYELSNDPQVAIEMMKACYKAGAPIVYQPRYVEYSVVATDRLNFIVDSISSMYGYPFCLFNSYSYGTFLYVADGFDLSEELLRKLQHMLANDTGRGNGLSHIVEVKGVVLNTADIVATRNTEDELHDLLQTLEGYQMEHTRSKVVM